MIIRFLLYENIVKFVGFVIEKQRLTATIATLIEAANGLLYQKYADILHSPIPQIHFWYKNLSVMNDKDVIQCNKSEKARFNMKKVVDQLIWRLNLQNKYYSYFQTISQLVESLFQRIFWNCP